MLGDKMRVFAVCGPFVPTNEPMTLLPYKQLRNIDAEIDVCALRHNIDYTLEDKLSKDDLFKKFNVKYVGDYQDILFNINNINLIKCLHNMKRYIDICVQEFDKKKYDVLYTSSFPAYSHYIGKKIKDKNPEVKWIANFTDPINHSPYKYDSETYKSYFCLEKIAFKAYNYFYVNDNYERIAFENADILVFICEEQRNFMVNQYIKYFNNTSSEDIIKKSVIVPLNYIDEWEEVNRNILVEKKRPYKTLAHFGRVYGLRKIEKFIYAIKELIEECPEYENSFKVLQFGEFKKTDLRLIKKLKLENYFQINSKIPYEYCINEMNNSDVLLIFDTIISDDEWQPYLPSKIIEYSIIGKNVLAITTKKSPCYRIMKNSNALCANYDIDDIKRKVKMALDGQKSVVNYKFENKEATKELINIINK